MCYDLEMDQLSFRGGALARKGMESTRLGKLIRKCGNQSGKKGVVRGGVQVKRGESVTEGGAQALAKGRPG